MNIICTSLIGSFSILEVYTIWVPNLRPLDPLLDCATLNAPLSVNVSTCIDSARTMALTASASLTTMLHTAQGESAM